MWSQPSSFGRRAFLAGSGLVVACSRSATTSIPRPDAAPAPLPSASASASASVHALFETYPALAKNLPRVALGRFPSAIERALSLAPDATVWIKRDDDFTRSLASPASPSPTPPDLERLFGGGKVRKLELYFGEARAQGKRRIITSGGVGSNRALAVALLGKALGFSVRLHLTPQPSSSLRVWFDAGKPHPAQHPGLRTTQVAIPANAFLARAAKKPFHYYWDVVNQSAE